LDTQVEVPLDFREIYSQELDEVLHGDAAGAVSAIRTRLRHSLLQEFLQTNAAIFQVVLIWSALGSPIFTWACKVAADENWKSLTGNFGFLTQKGRSFI